MSVSSIISRRFGRPEARRAAWFRKIKRIAKREDLHVYEHHMVWKDQDFFLKAKRGFTQAEGIPDTRCFVLQSAVRALENVPGDVAECGVRMGKSTFFMLTADKRERTYCLFDSWEGLSDPVDSDIVAGRNEAGWKEGDLKVDEEHARAALADYDNVEFYRGWIPKRFAEVANRTFALLHVDVDLYEPTRDSLEFFWPRIAPGGMIICDDYGSLNCPGARRACDELANRHQLPLIELPTGQCLVYKPAR